MIITLPADIIKITPAKAKTAMKAFKFCSQMKRMSIPQEIRNAFITLGVDMFVSPKEKCLYLTFGRKDKTQFQMNPRNGYVGCKKLFEWASNAEIPLFDDYCYSDYQIDKKNKIVKLNLERE